MSGIFSAFNIANKGLQAQQTAIHITGHNLSNSNTPGFSRQRVDIKADLAFNFVGVGQLGTGVKMTGIVRLVDDYVTKQIRQENSIYNKYGMKSEIMGQVEIVFNEPSDTGVNFNLGEMFDSWQELSKNPESLTSKTIVVEKSKTLADSLNHMSRQLNNLKGNTIEDIGKNVKDFNATVDKLDSLNKQIFNVAIKGQVPNDLLDQRDLLLKDLSSMAEIDTSFDKFGRVEVSMEPKVDGEMVVVLGKNVTGEDIKNIMSSSEDGKDISIGEVGVKVESGQIAGNIEGLGDIEARLKDLDEFAAMMAGAINGAHAGVDIFVGDPTIRAGNIKVNSEIIEDNDKIISGATPGSPPGDGTGALKIAGLRTEKVDGKVTIEGAYSNIVIKVGISKEYADNMVDNQEVLLDHLELRRESTSGVTVDEEVSNLIVFKNAYEANAKVISVLTDMLDTIINRMGV